MSGSRDDDAERVVVVGGSLGGLRTCESLRRHGHDGPIVLVGAEPELPYDRPPLSKEILTGAKQPDEIRLAGEGDFDELDVELLLDTRATDLDLDRRRIALSESMDLPYGHLVIATGASARELPGTPTLAGLHQLRTLDDAVDIRAGLESAERVVIVGGGYVGAEVAAAARSLGRDVTLLNAMPVMLPRGIGDLGHHIGQLHRDHGVDLRCGISVAGFVGTDRIEAVRTTDGATIDADLVVVGVGAEPNTGWLETSGLTIGDGVVCDDESRALGTEDVYAVGDVARWFNRRFDQQMRLEHWTNAGEQADAVARAICGHPEPFSPVPYMWSDQYGRRIQCFGWVTAGDEMCVVDGELGTDRFLALFGRRGRLVGIVGMDAGRSVAPYRRLLLAGSSYSEALAA